MTFYSSPTLTLGLPRMHYEKGERRDFLLGFVGLLQHRGFLPVLEYGYGSGMGYPQQEYLRAADRARFTTLEETYQQDYVLVLRCPTEALIRTMHPGACLISMLHYPTRPQRVELLRSLGLEAISLDSIKDDVGRRLVEDLLAVAWNGVEAAFEVLAQTYPAPGFDSPQRPPIHVTLLGAGGVGSLAVRAAANYGNLGLHQQLAAAGVPGVQITALEYDLTGYEAVMKPILESTDILVDATNRPDPSRAVIPNDWIACLPQHAVILDLSVDPYDCSVTPPFIKGIEGIPQGNLDQWKFAPDDPAYQSIPPCASSANRRHVVSCYSWPGIYPNACMEIYGKQLAPIMRTLIERGGIERITPHGRFFERAIARAQLSHWVRNGNALRNGNLPDSEG